MVKRYDCIIIIIIRSKNRRICIATLVLSLVNKLIITITSLDKCHSFCRFTGSGSIGTEVKKLTYSQSQS